MTAAPTHLRPPRPHLLHVSLCFTSAAGSLISWLVCCPDQGAHEDHRLGLPPNKGADTRYAAVKVDRSSTQGLKTRVLRAGTEVCGCTVPKGHTLRLPSAGQRTLAASPLSKGLVPMTSPPRAESRLILPAAAHASVGGTQPAGGSARVGRRESALPGLRRGRACAAGVLAGSAGRAGQ
jgi:hypothetical protein